MGPLVISLPSLSPQSLSLPSVISLCPVPLSLLLGQAAVDGLGHAAMDGRWAATRGDARWTAAHEEDATSAGGALSGSVSTVTRPIQGAVAKRGRTRRQRAAPSQARANGDEACAGAVAKREEDSAAACGTEEGIGGRGRRGWTQHGVAGWRRAVAEAARGVMDNLQAHVVGAKAQGWWRTRVRRCWRGPARARRPPSGATPRCGRRAPAPYAPWRQGTSGGGSPGAP